MKFNINGSGHVTKIAAMAIYRKNLQNRKTCDFETLPEASVNGALRSVFNDIDLFLGKVSLGRISQISGERL